ncbi:MAG: ORC1-type DNA replication protein [Thermoplasmata archaeon]
MEDSIFEPYLATKPIFKKDRDILRPSYIPDKLPHREKQIKQLASILAMALKGERPSNVLIFGKTGTGKTATVKYLQKEMEKAKRWSRVDYLYMNCEITDTSYSVLQNLGNRFIDDFDKRIPFTGWSTERVYNMLREKLDERKRVVVVVLDEIDKLVYKSGDDVLYHLTRINGDLKKAKVSIVGISNDLKFTEFLDPRVKSRLSDEKMVFPPYNAEELRDILGQRAILAFDDSVIDEGVTSLCSALAAQEHGDARRALDLLRVAAEIAERNNDDRITDRHVLMAKNQLELDCVVEAVKSLPTQSKLILLGIIMNEEVGATKMTTGDVYTTYKQLCRRTGMSILTQRRITDLISELDMLGLVNARVKSFGRGGRTKEIQSSVPALETRRILEKDDLLSSVKSFKLRFQTTLI